MVSTGNKAERLLSINHTTKQFIIIIKFNKMDGFIRVLGGTKYLVLLGLERYDVIYTRIRYLIGVKSGITYVSFS